MNMEIKMKKALYEDFLDMKIGQTVVVNINDSIADLAVFLGYNKEKGVAIVCDCLMNTNNSFTPNVSEYSEVFIFPTNREDLLHIRSNTTAI